MNTETNEGNGTAGRAEREVRPPVKAGTERTFRRQPMPVRCEICQWRGRRLTPRSAPCPACGSRVEFA